jgi:hypothetical protein
MSVKAKFSNRWLTRQRSRSTKQAFETGFHGDHHLLSLTSWLLPQCQAFVETGANVGTTARYVGQMFPDIQVYSCEPDSEAWSTALTNTRKLPNVDIQNITSPEFLELLFSTHPELCSQRNFFWLDAHDYGFEWPLRAEVAFITNKQNSGIIFIDDFRIEGKDEFKYCSYDGQSCDFDYIQPKLDPRHSYIRLTPSYTEHTSPHHPLVGVGIFLFGFDEVFLPSNLCRLFHVTSLDHNDDLV